jgi:3-deoxy-D-manno-octulosonic-acid transferase
MQERKPAEPARLPGRLRLLLFVYNLAFPLGLIAMLPAFIVKMIRRGKYRHKFGQRLGIYSAGVRERFAGKKWTWIHAVSVGESLIALKLINEMKRTQPDLHVALSTTTSTGFALASKSVSDWLEVIYNPLDFPLAVQRALGLVRPETIILVEAEVWPNLTALAKQRGIAIALVNARLSPRSERRFRRFRYFTGPIFRLIDLICVQEPEDVNKWTALGVDASRLHCTGSIKFDHAVPTASRAAEFHQLLAPLRASNAPVILAGSSFDGEEEIIARIFLELRPRFPGLFLIIAPRHVERVPEISRKLAGLGIHCTLRTGAQPQADCLLINTTGELRDWYHVATLVFIGKSLTAVGGQNPVEALMAGKPVIFGPHMENFQTIVHQLLAQKGALQVADANDLKNQIAGLLGDSSRREDLVERARAVIGTHAGSTARTASLLSQL